MSGWVKFHRKMIEWEWFTDVNTCHLFLYCLLRANTTESSFRGIKLNAGEFIAGRKSISTSTGLSEMQIRTSLNKLILTKEITIKSTNKFSIISITNWKSYQGSNQQVTSNTTNKQPTSNQQVTTDKEYKNIRIKEDKNIHAPNGVSFETWEDFKKLRKAKKAPVTETVISGIKKQADIAGWTIEEAIKECCLRGWQSFKAEWVKSKGISQKQNEDNMALQRQLMGIA